MVLRLGLHMMADVDNAQVALDRLQDPGANRSGTVEEGAKLLKALMTYDWRMLLMAKGIMWDCKFIPETMNLMTIKTINQFAREAIIHSKQRFEALAAKMCRKAAILPGQLLSSKFYGPIADHTGAGGVAHIKQKV